MGRKTYKDIHPDFICIEEVMDIGTQRGHVVEATHLVKARVLELAGIIWAPVVAIS
jgi:hypothetical protein